MTWQIIRPTMQVQAGAATDFLVIRAPSGPRGMTGATGPTGPGVTPPNFGTVTIVQPANAAALALADGSTLTIDNTIEIAGVDGTKFTFPGTSGVVAVLGVAQAFTSAQTISVAGALSQPGLAVTGAPVTSGGTATTTKPLMLVETIGATSNNWSTSGTMLGVNAPSGFGGNVIDIQVNGARAFSVASGGSATFGLVQTVFNAGIFVNSPNPIALGQTSRLHWANGLTLQGGTDGVLQVLNNATTISNSLSIPASANWQLGALDAATPVGQTLSAQSVVAGTLNTAAPSLIYVAPKGTGTGSGGSHVFQVAPASGSSGSTQNTSATVLTLDGSRNATFANQLTAGATVSVLSGGVLLAAGIGMGWTGRSSLGAPVDGALTLNNNAASHSVTICAPGSAILQLGSQDAASAIAQTLSVQNVVAGTSNTSGPNFVIAGSRGTGTGAGGSLLFQVAPAGSTGSAQNVLTPVLTLSQTLLVTFAGGIQASALPTADPHVAGRIWANSGVLTQSAG